MTTIEGVLTAKEHTHDRYDAPIDEPTPIEPPPATTAAHAVRAILVSFGYTVAFIVSQVLAGALLVAFSLETPSFDDLDGSGTLVLCAVEAFVLLTALLFVRERGGWSTLGVRFSGREQARGWVQLAPVGLLVIGPSFLAAALGDDPVFAPDLVLATALGLVAFAVLVGIAEELWFRGLVIARLGGIDRPWLAIVVSSLLFGAPHAFAASGSAASNATLLNAAAVTLAVAVPFACVRLRSASLVPLIGWHALIDIWAFVHTASVVAEGEPTTGELLAGLVLPALVAGGYLTWFSSTRDQAVTPTARRRSTTTPD